MEIVDAILSDSDPAGDAARFLHNLIEWFNLHPNLCRRMHGYLSSYRTTELDPSIKTSWIASLRILEHTVVKVLKPSPIPIHLATYQSYQRNVKHYTKDFFDIYCRIHRVTLYLHDHTRPHQRPRRLHTSVAQMNMVRWLLTSGQACISLANKRARSLGRYKKN